MKVPIMIDIPKGNSCGGCMFSEYKDQEYLNGFERCNLFNTRTDGEKCTECQIQVAAHCGDLTDFGAAIWDVAQAAGLDLDEVAETIGIGYDTLLSWMSGRIRPAQPILNASLETVKSSHTLP